MATSHQKLSRGTTIVDSGGSLTLQTTPYPPLAVALVLGKEFSLQNNIKNSHRAITGCYCTRANFQ
jgi:hypothetical protein